MSTIFDGYRWNEGGYNAVEFVCKEECVTKGIGTNLWHLVNNYKK